VRALSGSRGPGPALRRLSLRSALPEERLKPLGDDLNGASSAAIGGLPLAALEPTLDVDEASLAKVLAGEVGELAPEDHVVKLGVAFLYDLHRLNVAISRARCVAVIVGSPALLDAAVHTPQHLRAVNGLLGVIPDGPTAHLR